MTHHHDHALTTTASGDLIGEAGLLEFLILLCFMTSGNLWTQQSMDTALVLVILARDPWQLSLYTTASWRAELSPIPRTGQLSLCGEEPGGDGISHQARDGRKENQTNNKQSNSRTHVDFFEYIEMSCVDNT